MHYQNQRVLLASKHQKEKAIQPPFEEKLGCTIHIPVDYDTDQFGTFTGEIPRKASAYETLIQKAKAAAQQFGYRYVISSEGSFGPHPQLYFCPADTELMAFVDLDNDLIIAEHELSTETNYGHIDISDQDDYEAFLDKAKFPSHGIIIRTLDSENHFIEKGIRDRDYLKTAIKKAFDFSPRIRLETDMRAMMNPLRMNTINKLAVKLVHRIQQHCPQCHTPGFGKISAEGHLTCVSCGTPTELYHRKVLNCLKCEFKTYQARDDGLEFADQRYCPYCNP
ncbi:TPA: hypothetical protein RG395_002770 [Legionella pneumophila]|nr:DUF6671 family protein [Legionella pneumophila]MDW8880340.1 DUF6671 family protein [Legionella pneumophila subsp. fraseri]MDW8963266.1 DUF6671 family protein [Legionella pneumophila subsp. fraseri]MDW9036954.1 DUF6671 family protein [Legionella pneumophila subsp. fraseri]MDW9040113.1 DUF6671 family protein [Legionella pneumophila subsp. fraseri]MDW9043148.1 DUF6671 family protein [Legionella pneumophila subsp. fraseri]